MVFLLLQLLTWDLFGVSFSTKNTGSANSPCWGHACPLVIVHSMNLQFRVFSRWILSNKSSSYLELVIPCCFLAEQKRNSDWHLHGQWRSERSRKSEPVLFVFSSSVLACNQVSSSVKLQHSSQTCFLLWSDPGKHCCMIVDGLLQFSRLRKTYAQNRGSLGSQN